MKSINKFSEVEVLSKSQTSTLYGGAEKYETSYSQCLGEVDGEAVYGKTIYDVVKINDDGSTSTRLRWLKTWLQ